MAAEEFESKNEITVHGYVRNNFDNNFWIDEIIQIIIQFYMSKGGSLYVCGYGHHGKLGIEEYADKMCDSLTLCPSFQATTLDVSTGYRHTLLLDIYGDVWSCGSGDRGQLGDGKKENIYTPQKITFMHSVIQIAAGGEHSMVLLNNFQVLSFGRGKFGALGHDNDQNVLIPKVIESLKKHKIIHIEAGGGHSACLTEQGDVFCFGDNGNGQCGVGKEEGNKIMIPTKIKFDAVVSIECGDEVTLLIDKCALIYSFGLGEAGQLGHGDKDNRYEPTLIEALKYECITQCSSGDDHSICIDDKGLVWSFGDNAEGQCGFGEDVESQFKPAVIGYFVKNNIKAVQCSAGDNYSLIISEESDLYVFGNNGYYQLGLPEADNYYYTPQKITLPQVATLKKVCASWVHTAIITK